MDYYLDYNGTSCVFPDELMRIASVRYINASPFKDHPMQNLCVYFAWVTFLKKEFSLLHVNITSSFYDWMFSPYTEDNFDHASVHPPMPRIVLASLAFMPHHEGLGRLDDPKFRAHVIMNFIFQYNDLFFNTNWPNSINVLCLPTLEEPVPLILQAYRDASENLSQIYPCRNLEEKANYLYWSVQNIKELFPNSHFFKHIEKWLNSASTYNTGEGLSWLLAGLSTQAKDWGNYSLVSPYERLRFVAATIAYRPDIELTPWQWDELNKPYIGNTFVPKLAAGLASAIDNMTEKDLTNPANTITCLRIYLTFVLPLIKKYGLPSWLRCLFFKPALDSPSAREFGISNLMMALSDLYISPLVDLEKAQILIRNLFDKKNELPPDLFAAYWQLIAWRENEKKQHDVIPRTHEAYFQERDDNTISILGWVNAPGGVGEDCRVIYKALRDSHFSVEYIDVAPLVPIQGETLTKEPEKLTSATSIISLAAQDIYRLKLNSPSQWWSGRHTIGFCPWELPKWPKTFHCAIDSLDEIWAPSTFVARAFSGLGKKVVCLPSVVVPLAADGDMRKTLGIRQETIVFLFSFNFSSSYVRKNPLAVLEAFNIAFAGTRHDVCLIMKTTDATSASDEWQAMQRANKCGSKVFFINEWFSANDNILLMNTCDSFVSLHRSEGFGRLLAEAMTLEKLLIASDFGGNTDFTTQETAKPISGKLIPVKNGEYLFGEGQQWFDANIEHAAQVMREFAEFPERFARIRQAGKQYILNNYSPACFRAHVLETLKTS